MKDKLFQLFEALKQVEVKGESVLIMADCFRFIDQLAQECATEEQEESVNGK